MPDSDPIVRHWLSVHERVRKDIQRYVTLIAVLAAIAVIQGFGRLQHLNESYQLAREFTLQIQKTGPREEAARLFQSKCLACRDQRIRVRLEAIPEVGWEYDRYLSKNQPSGMYRVGGYEFGYASFAILVFFAPVALLALIYLRLRTTARITVLLRESAVDRSDVQQHLNSVFIERATESLGERRWVAATAWALLVVALAATPLVLYLTLQTGFVINTDVLIDKLGNITPLPAVDNLNLRTHMIPLADDMLRFGTALLLSILGLGLLVWGSTVHQLRPTKRSAKPLTNDAA